MLDCFELGDCAANLCGLNCGQHSDTDCRQYILQIVRALQRNLLGRHDLAIAMAVAPDYVPSTDEGPACDFLQSAEPVHRSLRSGSHLDARRVVRVENGKIVRALVLENASLGGGVIFKRMVPVKVIGGDVQHHCDARVKALYFIHLKAAELYTLPSLVALP